MASTEIPRVDDTDLDRDDLVEAAEELDLDHESLGDQELFEELGRRLGEIDEEPAGDGGEASEQAEDVAEEAPNPEQIREELEGRTRDQVRNELRELGLPVSGSKSELIERLAAARIGAAKAAGDASEQASDAAEKATDQASKTADQATDQASKTAEKATDQASKTADQATDQASKTAEKVTDQASKTADEATDQASETADEATDQAAETADETSEAAAEAAPDRETARDADEYRVEDDERENISPILDLELGPLALDVLGLDIHLNRVHAVLVANPGPKHAILGKLLSGVAKTTDKLGLSSAVDKVTDGVEKAVDVLPTPDTGQDDGGEEEDQQDEDDGEGILGRIRSRIAGSTRAAKDLVGNATDAAGSAKDATTDAVTSGGNAKAAKETRDAFKSAKKAGGSAKDVVTGSG
jgi:hypothetical protein